MGRVWREGEVTWKARLRSLGLRLRAREAALAWPVLIAAVWVGLFGASCLVGSVFATLTGAFNPLLLLWLLLGLLALALGYRMWRSGRRVMRS